MNSTHYAGRRRRGYSPFGAALLDLMTCGFGAMLLLFVIKDADFRTQEKEWQERRSMTGAMRTEIEARLAEAQGAIKSTWLERRASAQGPAVLGLPPIAGHLIAVIDLSQSMTSAPMLMKAAREVIPAVARASTELQSVTPIVFARRELVLETVPPSIAGTSSYWMLVIREDVSLDGCTNLVGALQAAFQKAAEIDGLVTVLLLSDGEHTCTLTSKGAMEPEDVIAAIASGDRINESILRRVTVHAIGLFGASDEELGASVGAEGDDAILGRSFRKHLRGGAPRLATLLRAITSAHRGVFVGLPVELDP